VSYSNYLGYSITCKHDDYDDDDDGGGDDVKRKVHKFQHMNVALIRTLMGKTRKETELKLYKVMTLLILFNRSEVWTLKKQNLYTIQATDMKFKKSGNRQTCLEKIKKGRYQE
jgi:hypothetical protein